MSPRTVTTFFALLAIASLAVVVASVVLAVIAPDIPRLARVRVRVTADLAAWGLAPAAIVMAVASLGSLYLSEVAGFRPCTLCWVQRGFAYPLAVVLLLAIWQGWSVRAGARIWALLGAAVSAWHVAVERFPAIEAATACSASNPCSLRWVEHFGFVTIPVMALAAFLLTAVLLSVRPNIRPSARSDVAPELECVP